MRATRIARWFSVFAAYCLLPAAYCDKAAAQPNSRYKIEIQYVRVGFPAGPMEPNDNRAYGGGRDSLYKFGAWTPVYITLGNDGKFNPDPKKDGPAVVIVETPDCDDTITNYTVPVPAFDEQDGLAGHATVVAYARTGSLSGDFGIRVVAGGKDMSKPITGPATGYVASNGLEPNQGLYLVLGARPTWLANIGKHEKKPDEANGNADNTERKSAVAAVTRVSELPTMWFGYDSVDLVILATSDRDFVLGLINDRVRSGALAEWVRRGGRLIVTAGSNADVLAGANDLNAMLPVEIGKSYTTSSAQVNWRDGGGSAENVLANSDAKKPVSLTGLAPKDNPHRAFRVLSEGPQGVAGSTPLIAQGPYGLGRVTVLAFDPDRPPASDWPGKDGFWKQLLARSGPHIPDSAGLNQQNFNYRGGNRPVGPADGELSQVDGYLGTFEGVPVISFGWVALFILIYILLVGPLDYLFLKKVVKRLEFTWITFPTIVLAVSAAAYFTAYHIKGSDLRINKLDLVDIDVQTGRAYGRSWFTLFSPQPRKYTVGVEPATPWVGAAESADPAVTVSWFGVAGNATPPILRLCFARGRSARRAHRRLDDQGIRGRLGRSARRRQAAVRKPAPPPARPAG
jgi:hypothetical protein